MATFQEALRLKPVHFITIIGRENGVGIDSNLRKPDLVDRVALALSNPASLSARLARLTSPQEQALMDLLAAGGRLPARYLAATYGPLRAPRKIIQLYRERARHSQQDTILSPLEQLCILGLVFHDPQTNDLFVPDDIVPHLPAPELPKPAPPASIPGPAPVDLLCNDLTCLLALLQRDEVALLHGRWLPPYFLQRWGQYCAVAPVTPTARSELQTGRRRFLHYLAEAGGLVSRHSPATGRQQTVKQEQKTTNLKLQTHNSQLVPTPAAWLWLNSTRQQRLQSLWQAWTQPDLERWQRYRLPGATWLADPARLLEPVHQAVLTIDPADPTRFADLLLKSQPHLVDLVPANMLNRGELLRETIVELLAGPLVWLGVLVNDELGMMDDKLTSHSSLIIHRFGHALLNEQPVAADEVPASAKFIVTSDIQPDPLASTLTFTLNDGLPEPADLMVALEVGSREYGVEGLKKTSPTSYSLLLTPISFIRALHRGWSPPALLDALNRLAQRPLTGQETGLLRTWADLAGRMTISPTWLLETTDPDIITRLASTRRGRSLIHRTLSPRAVVVDPARLDNLVRRLTEQEGVPPKDEFRTMNNELIHHSSLTPALRAGARVTHHSHSAHLWLLLKVYQNLGQHIQLPVRMPQSLVDRLAEMLSPAEMAGAEVAAEQTLAALQQALDGQTPFPPWPEDGLPVEQSLAVIEQAMTTGQNVKLLYYAASTDRLTRRVVEPYRLQWHGAGEMRRLGDEEIGSMKDNLQSLQSGTPYLIGFCHHTQAERMFRLDRIREIEMEDWDAKRGD